MNGFRLYVKEALKKDERENEKKKEQFRFKNSKKRCNLYVKNFPPTTTEDELTQYFEKFGDIESVKVFPKEGEALYAFVCYKSPDHAALAKQQVPNQPLQGKTLYVNHYELKEVRKIQQEEARDRADFQNYQKQMAQNGFNPEILNKPEVFQLIQMLLMQLNRAQGFRQNNMGFQNRPRGPNPRYNNHPGGMPNKPHQMGQPLAQPLSQPLPQSMPNMQMQPNMMGAPMRPQPMMPQ